MERKWLIRWLYAAAVLHIAVGLALPLLAGAPMLDAYHTLIAKSFSPAVSYAQQAWWIALFGPTIQCVGVLMLALTCFGDTRREPSAWLWLIASLLLWAPQDMLISLRAGVWPNLWIDAITLALLLPPLLRLYRIDSRVASEHGAVGEGELFRKILGAEWSKLHPDIQTRFAKNPEPGKPLLYYGALSELSASRIGKVLGFVSKPLIQGALIPYDDRNFPVDIQVYSKQGCSHIFKQRIYMLNNRKPIRFTSFMAESEKGEVLEYVGMGLGMKLKLQVDNGSLHFTSDGYFWDVLGWRIPLPGLLTPGKTYLWHHNEAPNRFNIRIEIRHALFGLMFTQVGVFHERHAAEKEAA